MSSASSRPSTAFQGHRMIASGPLAEVALAAKAAAGGGGVEQLLVFDDERGTVVDLDLRGSPAEIAARLSGRQASPGRASTAEERGRGRPKLGVVAREVTLLPRHWEWLAAQPGGASAALRRLVDEARHADGGQSDLRARREAAYRFMSAMAGDRAGFEEATRALFAGDEQRFRREIASWPEDIGSYAERLASGTTRSEAISATDSE